MTYPCSVGGKVIERKGFCVFLHFKQQDTLYVPNNRTQCMCQTTGHTVWAKLQDTLCAKQQDILYVPNNRTHCMCQITGHTICAKQQDTLYVPNNRNNCMCQTTGHTLYAKQQDTLYVPTNTLMKINRLFNFANTKAQI